ALAKILLPAKNAVKMVESKSTITADVFLYLIQMAVAINILEKDNLYEHMEFFAQIKMYDAYEPPYNFAFVEGVESPQTWWNG
ncbi:29261_t:CDS:2, partial [Racocetra persica]